MSWVITDPRGVEDALADGAPAGRDVLGLVVERPPRSRVERLDVYAEAYFARLLECLEEDFPALKRVLGDNLFGELAAAYLEAHPSKSYTAADLGAKLAEFLVSYELSADLPYLPELARLEWAVVTAFFARELPPLDTSRLQRLTTDDWPRLRLKLDPSATLVRSAWNIDDMRGDTAQPAAEADRRLLVWREGEGHSIRVRVERLEEAPFVALERMRAGDSLGEVCDALEARLDVDAELPPLMDWFKGWVERGVIREAALAAKSRSRS